MSPVSARRRGGATYRYYVSSAIQKGQSDRAGVHGRVSAPVVEAAVHGAIQLLLPALEKTDWAPARDLIDRIDLGRDELIIRLDPARCDVLVVADAGRLHLGGLERIGDAPVLRRPIMLSRRGALVMAGPGGSSAVVRRALDPALNAALIRAEAWKRRLLSGDAPSLDSIARDESLTAGYAARLIRIAFLAPDLKRAILDGVQPQGLPLQAVMTRDVPLAWDAQHKLYAG